MSDPLTIELQDEVRQLEIQVHRSIEVWTPRIVELEAKVKELEKKIDDHFEWLHKASSALFTEREDMEAEIEQLRRWQRTSEGADCSGFEQLNRIVAGLVRQYGADGELTLANIVANGVPIGQQITWACTCGADDFIVIREVSTPSRKERQAAKEQ